MTNSKQDGPVQGELTPVFDRSALMVVPDIAADFAGLATNGSDTDKKAFWANPQAIDFAEVYMGQRHGLTADQIYGRHKHVATMLRVPYVIGQLAARGHGDRVLDMIDLFDNDRQAALFSAPGAVLGLAHEGCGWRLLNMIHSLNTPDQKVTALTEIRTLHETPYEQRAHDILDAAKAEIAELEQNGEASAADPDLPAVPTVPAPPGVGFP